MKLTLAIAAALFAVAIGTLLAEPGHRGYPNPGIVSPGHPNHYASPHPQGHP